MNHAIALSNLSAWSSSDPPSSPNMRTRSINTKSANAGKAMTPSSQLLREIMQDNHDNTKNEDCTTTDSVNSDEDDENHSCDSSFGDPNSVKTPKSSQTISKSKSRKSSIMNLQAKLNHYVTHHTPSTASMTSNGSVNSSDSDESEDEEEDTVATASIFYDDKQDKKTLVDSTRRSVIRQKKSDTDQQTTVIDEENEKSNLKRSKRDHHGKENDQNPVDVKSTANRSTESSRLSYLEDALDHEDHTNDDVLSHSSGSHGNQFEEINTFHSFEGLPDFLGCSMEELELATQEGQSRARIAAMDCMPLRRHRRSATSASERDLNKRDKGGNEPTRTISTSQRDLNRSQGGGTERKSKRAAVAAAIRQKKALEPFTPPTKVKTMSYKDLTKSRRNIFVAEEEDPSATDDATDATKRDSSSYQAAMEDDTTTGTTDIDIIDRDDESEDTRPLPAMKCPGTIRRAHGRGGNHSVPKQPGMAAIRSKQAVHAQVDPYQEQQQHQHQQLRNKRNALLDRRRSMLQKFESTSRMSMYNSVEQGLEDSCRMNESQLSLQTTDSARSSSSKGGAAFLFGSLRRIFGKQESNCPKPKAKTNVSSSTRALYGSLRLKPTPNKEEARAPSKKRDNTGKKSVKKDPANASASKKHHGKKPVKASASNPNQKEQQQPFDPFDLSNVQNIVDVDEIISQRSLQASDCKKKATKKSATTPPSRPAYPPSPASSPRRRKQMVHDVWCEKNTSQSTLPTALTSSPSSGSESSVGSHERQDRITSYLVRRGSSVRLLVKSSRHEKPSHVPRLLLGNLASSDDSAERASGRRGSF